MTSPQVIRSIVARRPVDRIDGDEPEPALVLVRIALLALAIRGVLYAAGLAAVAAVGYPDPLRASMHIWSRWDAPHYLRLADVGYQATGEDGLFIVFFPGYPVVVSIVAFVLRDLVFSGLVVSYAASVGAGWFLYRLVRLDAGHDEAWRAVLLLFAFPTAYYFAVPYSEAMFLLAVTASMYAARTGRWPRSALAGAAATATRVAGIALIPALAVEALALRRLGSRAKALAWAGTATAGLGAYLLLNQAVHGDALRFLDVQRAHWHQQAVPPWEPIVAAVRRLVRAGIGSDFRLIYAGRIAAAAFAVGVLAAAIRRLRLADQVYGWAGFILVLSVSWLISLPRYLLGIYPLFVALAWLLRDRRIFVPVLAASAVGQAYFFSLYARGAWTF